jgi:Bifunctional DNA primase/polymerase, N-terminal/AAA domain
VFPLKYRTKDGHLTKSWAQAATTDPQQVAAEFAGRDLNYGIACGPSGLLVVDEDRPGALARYAADHGHVTPHTYTVSTGKGRHHYYQAPLGWNYGNRAGSLANYGIDVRSGNGYVLGAGSIHPNGTTYTADNGHNPAPLPDWVAAAIIGADQILTSPDIAFELPDIIPAGTRDETLFKYACSLRAQGTKIVTAGQRMRKAWERCQQPPGQLYTLDQAFTKLDQAWGYAYERTEPEKAADALTAEISRQRLTRTARKHLDDEAAIAAFREPPSRYDLAEELTIVDPPITYLVEGVFPAGANVLLTAQYKAGKTTLVNHLTRCLADEEKFLGVHVTARLSGRIALFNYEVDERQYRAWLRELGVHNPEAVSVLNLRGYRLPILTTTVEDWIVAWLESRGVQLWVVDPFARAFVGSGISENDNTQVGAFLDALDVIKTRAGVSELVMPTHTGRVEFEEGSERARGATRLDDWADVRWMLTKDTSETRYFSATGRDVDCAETALKFEEPTRQLAVVGGTRRQTRKDRVYDAALSVVEANPGIGLDRLRRAIREIVDKTSNDAIATAIEKAEDRHEIRVERQGPGKMTAHWRIEVTVVSDGDVA